MTDVIRRVPPESSRSGDVGTCTVAEVAQTESPGFSGRALGMVRSQGECVRQIRRERSLRVSCAGEGRVSDAVDVPRSPLGLRSLTGPAGVDVAGKKSRSHGQ